MRVEEKLISLKDGRTLLLRSPHPHEADKAIVYLVAAFRESYRNMNMSARVFEKMTVEEERKILEGAEAGADRFMIGAFDGDRIVGMLGIFGGGAEFVAQNGKLGMSVLAEFYGVGLGFELMKHAIASARSAEIHRIELSVRTYNEAGIRLYEKSGFRRIGEAREASKVDGEYVNEYLYELIL